MQFHHCGATEVAHRGGGFRLHRGGFRRPRGGGAGVARRRPVRLPRAFLQRLTSNGLSKRSGRNRSIGAAEPFPAMAAARISAVTGASRMPFRTWPVAYHTPVTLGSGPRIGRPSGSRDGSRPRFRRREAPRAPGGHGPPARSGSGGRTGSGPAGIRRVGGRADENAAGAAGDDVAIRRLDHALEQGARSGWRVHGDIWRRMAPTCRERGSPSS